MPKPLLIAKGNLKTFLESLIDSSLYASDVKLQDMLDSIPSVNMGIPPKDLYIFIGGFCDTFHLVLFKSFYAFLESNPNKPAFYTTFNCFNLLRNLIPKLENINIVSHSWGAKNILRLSLKYNFHIENLITLDCVGRFDITHRPSNIRHWENIYISNYFKVYNRSNIAALIGGAKGEIKFANSNISLDPPAHHASVRQMLEKSELFKLF